MCGIAGAILFDGKTEPEVLLKMISTLKHRGPDNQNILKKRINNVDIGFAHSRLSIIDLSNGGTQPMSFRNLSIVFNGEIYNYQEIKDELIRYGNIFHTTSDTEVVLQAFEKWGENAVHRFIGMFAFAILDEDIQTIYLYRDRSGVKPLYYYWDNNNLIFGSELKAILEHPGFKKEINKQAVGYFFKMGYIPCPLSIYENTYKINPGHFVKLNLSKRTILLNQYWNSLDYYNKSDLTISYEEAKEEITRLLISSCNYRMVSDVPVGIFLSGGYDSTLVTAILQKDRTERLKTFTIGFDEGNNEAPYAKETARHLGTDHHEFTCTTKEAQNIIQLLPYYFDEPFSDSSAIPTILVSHFAKNQVTVALSADGGDEIFAGYESYRSLYRNMNLLKRLKLFDNKISGALLIELSKFLSDESFLSQKMDYLGQLFKGNEVFRACLIQEGAQSLSSKIFNNLLRNIKYPSNILQYKDSNFNSPISVGQAVDYNMVFHNDILTKVDRATMSVSLEGREPLIDHRIFEFVAKLPIDFKFNEFGSKRILKDITTNYIPKSMMDRPKTGFSLPIGSWLRGDLAYLIDEYLNKESIEQSGILNYQYVNHLIQLFNSRKLHNESIIWRILQYQMWFKKWA